jgi:hypothetical protein
MKTCTLVLITTLIAAMPAAVVNAQTQPNSQQSGEANSQMQQEQQACQGDVYALCGEAIPDVDRITTCLRSRWKDVSQECRAVMASYGRNHKSRRDQQNSAQ